MIDDPRALAFDFAAPAAERFDANAELAKTYTPLASDLLPDAAVREMVDWIQSDLEEQALLKAQRAKIIPFPGDPPRRNQHGMQSVLLDRYQIGLHGDFFERPGALNFDSLRTMVEQTPVLSAVVLTRIRQINRFSQPSEDGGPGFELRHIDRQHQLAPDEQRSLALLARFFQHCGWEWNPRRRRRLQRDNFTQFMAKLTRDSLVLDAAAIETELKARRDLGIDGLYAVDGASIRLCSEDGYQGDEDFFAVQVVQGQVRTVYTRDDLIYEPRNPRTDLRLAGYGMSETELLIRVVTGFLNAMTLNLKGFSDNSIPRGILHLVGDYSKADLDEFKRRWYQLLKGTDNAWALPVMTSSTPEGKAQFTPTGVEFNEMYFSKWMTFLTSMICAVYGMSPDEINFESFTAGKSSLSGSDTAEKLADSKDKGLRPLLSYFEALFTDFIVADFSDKYVFRWVGLDVADEQKEWEAKKLILTVNELRAEQGYEALDGPLGDAPLNPTLMGPWMQLMQAQQPEDFGQPEGQEPGGENGDQGDKDGQKPPRNRQDDTEDSPATAEQQQENALHKANPYHDDLGRFTDGIGAAQQKITEVINEWKAQRFAGRATSILPVSPTIQHAARVAGLDLTDYHHAIDPYAIQHVMTQHGNPVSEMTRGQLPVTEQDFLLIPDIVNHPEAMGMGSRNKVGRQLLSYVKHTPDGALLHLEEIRTGRKQLALLSMQKYPGTRDAAALLRNPPLYAHDDTGNSIIIVQFDPSGALTKSTVWPRPALPSIYSLF